MTEETSETENTTVTSEPYAATKRFRAVLPRALYKTLLKEAVEQEVAPNELLVRVVGNYFREAK